MRFWLGWIGGTAVALYLFYLVAMVVLHRGFIYPFAQDQFAYDAYQRQSLVSEHSDPLEIVTHMGAPDAPVVVYFMGNIGALQIFASMLEHHREQGRSVIAMTYRGGGGIAGEPSEAQLKRDAETVMKFATDFGGGPLVVQGYSLGTGLAAHVAARFEVDGVLLVSPYARLCELMAARAKLPACYVPGIDAWKTLNDLPQIKAPVQILHGSADRLIAPSHSARVADTLKNVGVPVDRLVIEGGAHSDLLQFPEYLQAIDRFIDGL